MSSHINFLITLTIFVLMLAFPPSRLLEYSTKFMSGASTFGLGISRFRNPINSAHPPLVFKRFSTGRLVFISQTEIAGFALITTTLNYVQFSDLSITLGSSPNPALRWQNSARHTVKPCANLRSSWKTVFCFFTNRSSALTRTRSFS